MADQLQTLVSVLDDKLLVVADYQRPYACLATEAASRSLGRSRSARDRARYAGTLVLQRTDRVAQTQEGRDVTTFEVDDGQQRLTTCLVLLDHVRRRLSTLVGRDLPGVEDALIDLRRLLHVSIGGVRRPRLTLGAELHRFFANSILGDEVPDRPSLLAGEQRSPGGSRILRQPDCGAGRRRRRRCGSEPTRRPPRTGMLPTPIPGIPLSLDPWIG